jgi:drug/metabolite transporter (DMT)-like permease
MFWFIPAILTAISKSVSDVFGKKVLKNLDEYVTAFALRFFITIIMIPVLYFIDIPKLNNQFWVALIISGILNVIALILYMKALKISDLSLTVPFLTFTPLFLLLTSPLILGEFPSYIGVIGVLLIVGGAYSLKISKIKDGWMAPLKSIIKEKGSLFMLIVAFIYSISSNFDKIGVVNSSPLFWVFAISLFNTLLFIPILAFKSPKGLRKLETHWKPALGIGIFAALSNVFQMVAIKLTLVAYVISIKRTSAIFGVIFGVLFFKEKGLKERLFGALLMVLGVVLITLG